MISAKGRFDYSFLYYFQDKEVIIKQWPCLTAIVLFSLLQANSVSPETQKTICAENEESAQEHS